MDNESLAAAMQSDRLLGGFGPVELKILLDIVTENQRAEGFTAAEIGAAPGAFTKQAGFPNPSLLAMTYFTEVTGSLL